MEQFINQPVPGHVHASSIVKLPNGDYLAVWFEGTKESAADVAIVGSRRINGAWTPSQCIAKIANKAHWNPVLRLADDGRVVLYFKVSATIDTWQTYTQESRDGGITWSPARELVPGDTSGGRGPVKNKCLRLTSGRWLAGGSTEIGVWRAFFDISDDDGKTWRRTPDIQMPADEAKLGVIQPTLWQDADGNVHALMRSNSGALYRTDSFDDGTTWTTLYRTSIPNNNSGVDLVRIPDGRIFLACNPVAKDWGPRTRLDVLVSQDNGDTWNLFKTLIDDPHPHQADGRGTEYSYPAVIDAGGKLAITFTFNRHQIRFVELPY